MSVSTANSVLINRTLRWSSPVCFNDPFDVPRELSFGISAEELMQATVIRFKHLINQPPEDTSQLLPQVRLIIEAVKRADSPELTKQLLAEIEEVGMLQCPSEDSMEQLRVMWRTWLLDYRILCFTESPSHAAMWYHYADAYRGVVLEFRCDDELDSPWLAARPVTYPSIKPAIYSAEGWAKFIFLQPEAAMNAIFQEATYTKSTDWSYENEWRLASFKRDGEIGNFSDYSFNPKELQGIYFGPMISPSDRNQLRAAVTEYPLAKLWDVSIGMSREFNFAAIPP